MNASALKTAVAKPCTSKIRIKLRLKNKHGETEHHIIHAFRGDKLIDVLRRTFNIQMMECNIGEWITGIEGHSVQIKEDYMGGIQGYINGGLPFAIVGGKPFFPALHNIVLNENCEVSIQYDPYLDDIKLPQSVLDKVSMADHYAQSAVRDADVKHLFFSVSELCMLKPEQEPNLNFKHTVNSIKNERIADIPARTRHKKPYCVNERNVSRIVRAGFSKTEMHVLKKNCSNDALRRGVIMFPQVAQTRSAPQQYVFSGIYAARLRTRSYVRKENMPVQARFGYGAQAHNTGKKIPTLDRRLPNAKQAFIISNHRERWIKLVKKIWNIIKKMNDIKTCILKWVRHNIKTRVKNAVTALHGKIILVKRAVRNMARALNKIIDYTRNAFEKIIYLLMIILDRRRLKKINEDMSVWSLIKGLVKKLLSLF